MIEVERDSSGKRRALEEPYVVMLDAEKDFTKIIAL